MREKILTYIERNSRVDLKDLAIMLGTEDVYKRQGVRVHSGMPSDGNSDSGAGY